MPRNRGCPGTQHSHPAPAQTGLARLAPCAVTFPMLKSSCTGTSAPALSRQSRASTRLGSTVVILAPGSGYGLERLQSCLF